jgi:hypothetical protein
MKWLLRLSLKKVLTENIISFKNQFDFYTDDLKKYWLKIKLVLKYEMTFEIVTEKSVDGKYN